MRFSNVSSTNYGMEMALAVILGICTALFILVIGLMVFFVIKYHRSRAPRPRRVKESLWLEIAWTIIPLGIVMVMFWYGYMGYAKFKRTNYENPFEVTVIGRMWLWEYEYPNGVGLQHNLYLPVNTPVKLTIQSVDVNHSFYIPAFRIKQDAIPGFDNYMQFEANVAGTYDIYCAEYCGLQHAYMLGKVHVLEQAEFEEWMAEQEAELAKAAEETGDADPAESAVNPAQPETTGH